MSISMMPDAPVRAAPVRVVLGSVLLAGLYSGTGYYVPYIVVPILILALTVVLLPLGYAKCARGFFARLLTAVVGAALGVLTLWAVWYGLEFGWTALRDLAKLSPPQIFARIVSLSDQIVYTTSSDGGDLTHGTGMTKGIWLLETAVFALTPVLGAMAGPKGHAWFQRLSDRHDARLNARRGR